MFDRRVVGRTEEARAGSILNDGPSGDNSADWLRDERRSATLGRMDAKRMSTPESVGPYGSRGTSRTCKSNRVFQVFPIKHLILHVVLPERRATAPELLPSDSGAVDALARARVPGGAHRSRTDRRHGAGSPVIRPALIPRVGRGNAYIRTITSGSSGQRTKLSRPLSGEKAYSPVHG